jgi:LysR family glycine cleavage system transcriptional activator
MMTWMPSLNALRAFEATARHLSYRRAAEELHVSPAAVKQLVAKLEHAMGTPLLVRDGRGLALTQAGVEGSQRLAPAFREIAGAVEAMRVTEQRRRLILSVEPSFATAWLVPRLDDFRRRHPEVDVLVDSSLHLVDIERGAADLAIRFWNGSDDGLVMNRLFDEELCAFCSPALVEGADAINSLEDLERTTLLHWDLSAMPWAHATRMWMGWTPWLARVGAEHIKTGEGLRFSDYNMAVQAAIAGQGVILGSGPVFRDLVASGLLVSPIREKVVTDIGYDLLASERSLGREEVRSFRDWIIETAQPSR